MESNLQQSTKVTISDCGKALNHIEAEIKNLERERLNVQRSIDALRTQGFMISQLVRYL